MLGCEKWEHQCSLLLVIRTVLIASGNQNSDSGVQPPPPSKSVQKSEGTVRLSYNSEGGGAPPPPSKSVQKSTLLWDSSLLKGVAHTVGVGQYESPEEGGTLTHQL